MGVTRRAVMRGLLLISRLRDFRKVTKRSFRETRPSSIDSEPKRCRQNRPASFRFRIDAGMLWHVYRALVCAHLIYSVASSPIYEVAHGAFPLANKGTWAYGHGTRYLTRPEYFTIHYHVAILDMIGFISILHVYIRIHDVRIISKYTRIDVYIKVHLCTCLCLWKGNMDNSMYKHTYLIRKWTDTNRQTSEDGKGQ